VGELAVIEHEPISEPIPLKGKRTKPPAKLCHGHSKRHGGPCGANAMKGMDVCADHGGMSLRGAAHPNFKDGSSSKYMPKRLLEHWHEAVNDPALLHLSEDAAALKMRQQELFANLDDRNSSELWDATQKAYTLYEKALRSGKPDPIAEAQHVLHKTIIDGHNQSQNWREIREIAQERVTVSKEERARLKDTGQTMTYVQANALCMAVAAAVQKWITNREERAGLSAAIYALMTAG
jgi:hypothetical protein